MHDPRIGRFFAVDPLAINYPWNSPYSFSENDVIRAIELEGAEKMIVIHQHQNNGDTKIEKIEFDEPAGGGYGTLHMHFDPNGNLFHSELIKSTFDEIGDFWVEADEALMGDCSRLFFGTRIWSSSGGGKGNGYTSKYTLSLNADAFDLLFGSAGRVPRFGFDNKGKFKFYKFQKPFDNYKNRKIYDKSKHKKSVKNLNGFKAGAPSDIDKLNKMTSGTAMTNNNMNSNPSYTIKELNKKVKPDPSKIYKPWPADSTPPNGNHASPDGLFIPSNEDGTAGVDTFYLKDD